MQGTRNVAAQVAARAVQDLAVQIEGDDATSHHPALFECAVPTPLGALRAARALMRELHEHVRSCALAARAAGEEWERVAESLGLLHDGRADASAAYLAALGLGGNDPWWSPARGVLWQCHACGEVVRDFGPEAGGPEDREDGHAPTCARHVAEQVAWEALWR